MNNPTIYVSLDKIVFEGREQRYGAYSMRSNYDRLLARAMLITFLLFLSLTGLPKVIEWVMPPEEMLILTECPMVPLTPISLVKDPEPEPEPTYREPAAPPPAPIHTIEFLVIRPRPDDEVDLSATIAEDKDLEKAALGFKDSEGADGKGYNFDELIGDGDGTEFEFEDEKDTLPGSGAFVPVDREPKPVNLEEVKALIGYPRMAVEAEIEGKVTVRILVSKHGDYMKHVVLKDPHPILTKAVTDQISQLKMTPGIRGVKPIAVWVTIPFEFSLLNSSK
jgi:periplasmic protein TonB